ncbi:uncharacterized protein LOC110708751 [Chenopodium quinoa]|uniref:uncharacterized protein LOC110708751 n=1 Tax=Chenopodium quinoa TaxID=63459 RepID=UPI000B778F09|nr:uncharacterized protein LOC110708751 [Chenopodium quinoa]
MDSNLEAPTSINGGDFLSPPSPPPLQKEDDNNDEEDDDDFYIDDSNCSTPFVSAPSSPGRSYYPSGFFYSAPASPMHFVLATAQARSSAGGGLIPASSDASSSTGSFEFEFSARFDLPAPEIGPPMSSADELFLNGQIRPMRLCAHLQRPQKLPSLTLLESEREDEEDDDYCDDDDEKSNVFQRSRLRNRSQRRRTRSLSPLRSTAPFEWYCSDDAVSTPTKKAEEGESEAGGEKEKDGGETTPSGSSSRCSSAGRSSKRWVFLKDFLRSKSEGRSNNKFWHNINISFSPAKEKREKGSNNNSSNVNENTNVNANTNSASCSEDKKAKKKEVPASKGKGMPGGKRRSAHEMHYAANRAQAEEMRKKTFLPYRQGLLGCLGFNSKSYGALNGFARALNPVSSR